jgi:hypothetical protein
MAFEAIEATYLGDQLKDNIGRLVNNMRDNANAYKAGLSPPINYTPAQIGPVMKQDADRYLARIQAVVDLAQRSNTKYQAALAANGWVAADLNQLRTVLTDVANHTNAATLTNATQINNEADYILANVPIFERTF